MIVQLQLNVVRLIIKSSSCVTRNGPVIINGQNMKIKTFTHMLMM